MDGVKERPILFSAPMVRALLNGRKTQTRRAVKPQPSLETQWWEEDAGRTGKWIGTGPSPATGGTRQTWGWAACPYGQPGAKLWVRETWQGPIWDGDFLDRPEDADSPKYCEYAADGGPTPEYMDGDDNLVCRWRPSIHMPRWASRITVEITSVRVERLQDISESDAIAEGCKALHLADPPTFESAKSGYMRLWDSINGAGSWEANPWVWCIEFKRVTP